MRHVLTMAVGVGTAIRIRYYAVPLKPRRHHDAIERWPAWGCCRRADRADSAEAHATLQDKCRNLIAAAHAAGSPDNVTVLLIRQAG